MNKLLLIILITISSSLLYSHPHVFIDSKVELEDLTSATISWTFDLIESENKIYFFDDDGDKKLNPQETINLYNEGFLNLKESNFFITLGADGRDYPVQNVKNFNVNIEDDGRLTFNFDIDLPQMGSDDKLSITFFDTSYFISFSDTETDDITLPENLYTAVLKDNTTPYYYDPSAGRNVVLDTSKPQPGWLKAYPARIFISHEPIINSFGNYKITLRDKLNQIQKVVYKKLSETIASLQKNRSLTVIFYILLVSFAYGAIHALGPGHRKVVISSYILTKPNIGYIKSILISLGSALIHSGSGIIIIVTLNFIADKVSPIFVDSLTQNLEFISYLSILILSITLIILKIIPKRSKSVTEGAGLSLIFLSSMAPCPGALTIMLFSITLKMMGLGFITVIAMSLGIGLTLSLISVVTLKGKKIVENRGAKKFDIISKIFEWSGLIALLLFSLIMITI